MKHPPRKIECDCCKRIVPRDELARVWAFGIETFACEVCKGAKEEPKS